MNRVNEVFSKFNNIQLEIIESVIIRESNKLPELMQYLKMHLNISVEGQENEFLEEEIKEIYENLKDLNKAELEKYLIKISNEE